MKILVRAPNWIGDQVLAFPFFHYLRKAYPGAHITSVCVEWVKDLQFMGYVNDVVVLPKARSGSLIDKYHAIESAAQSLKKRGPFDLGITLPHSLGSAWFLWRAGCRIRTGYDGEMRRILLTHPIDFKEAQEVHRSQAWVNLIPKDIDKESSPPDTLKFWGEKSENELDPDLPGVLPEFDAGLHWRVQGSYQVRALAGSEYWVLAPGATADSRRWPTSYFVRLAKEVWKKWQIPCVIVGGLKEVRIAQTIMQEAPECKWIDHTAEGTVPSLYPIFTGAKFTLTNESGLAHVAALCGSFVQIVCGAADPRHTRPLGPGRVQVAVNPISCWPCEKNVCTLPQKEQKNLCLRGIDPMDVLTEIERGCQKKYGDARAK